ncbi:MAG: hypothetical protein P4L56_03505 [Candidatus Sulfopaludibacter sp.]|nr:hypothetical protein [Candidatus Sulfopaludibacter sp.]
MRVPLYLAICMAAAPLPGAQDNADAAWQLTVRLSQVRRQAAKALQEQPDFTCLATFDRYYWMVNEREERKIDTVRVEVAFVGGRELYSWPGEDKFSDTPLTRMVGAGMMGDGDFAVHAHNIFVANAGTEKWSGEEQENGRWGTTDRKLWHWTYRVSPYQSGWLIGSGTSQQTVGSEGSFWVDARTLDLVRMETRATDFFASFPLKAVESWVDYRRVRIGEQDVLMPLRGQLKTVSQDGSENRNLTTYSNCRQYSGHSTISFGAPPEVAAPTPAPAARIESRLPPGLALKIRLDTDLAVATASVGDPLEATLAAALHDGKTEIAPKGAHVRGRVRFLRRDTTAGRLPGAPEPYTEAGLVFDEVEFAGRVYRFAGVLKSFDTALPGVRMAMTQDRNFDGVTMARQQINPVEIPGASVFFIDSRSSGLPSGTLMTWITQP